MATPLEEWNAEYTYHWGIPGERIRNKIKNAVPQLRALSLGRHPTLLVLFDAVKWWPELMNADALKVAMYGIETAAVSSEVAPEGGATIIGRWHGSRRRLTDEHNTTLSAIGILSGDDAELRLGIYHNFFAAAPIPSDWLVDPKIQQYRLAWSPDRAFPPWETIA